MFRLFLYFVGLLTSQLFAQELIVNEYASPAEYHRQLADVDVSKKYIFQMKISKFESDLLFFDESGQLIKTLPVRGIGTDNPFKQRAQLFENRALIITQDFSEELEGGSPVKIISQIYSRMGEELGRVEDKMQSLRYFSDSTFILADNGYEQQRETCAFYAQNGTLIREMPELTHYSYMAERDGLYLCYANNKLIALNKNAEVLWEASGGSLQRNTLSVSRNKRICFTGVNNVYVLDSLGQQIVKLNVSDKLGSTRAVISEDGRFVFWASTRATRATLVKERLKNWHVGILGMTDIILGRHVWTKSANEEEMGNDVWGSDNMGFLVGTEYLYHRTRKPARLDFYSKDGKKVLDVPMPSFLDDKVFYLDDQLLLYNRKSGLVRTIEAVAPK
ncbi:MAG: hypothetical protein ACRBF0_11525 [Calditrichia bacterium]